MVKNRLHSLLGIALGAGLLYLSPVLAENTRGKTDGPACATTQAPQHTPTPDGQVEVEAQKAEVQGDGSTRLSGNVTVRQGQRLIQAAEAVYDANTHILQLRGKVIYQDPNMQVESQGMSYNQQTQNGEFGPSEYMLFAKHLRGAAQHIVQQNKNVVVITQLSFTTCEKGHEVWVFKARKLTINNESEQGVAQGSVLYVQGIPVFYLPYLRFPTSAKNRLTGFLIPQYSYNSVDGNLSLGLPFYWNIAPNYDATITPNFMSRRGTMLATEFRYLSHRSHGILNFEALPHDPLYSGLNRWYGRYEHTTQWGPYWTLQADVTGVSDADYLIDVNHDLDSSPPYYQRALTLSYNGESTLFDAQVLSYQVLDGSVTTPFSLLPSLRYRSDYHRRPNAGVAGFDLRLEHFANAGGDDGLRQHLELHYDYERSGPAGYWHPSLHLYTTYYDVISPTPLTFTRIVPSFSMDSGLFLERQTRHYTQTLEPRLFYLNVPYVDQTVLSSNNINYDTTPVESDFDSLFRISRYNGLDRIGDDHHIAIGLTTRYLNNRTGREWLRLSLGQIFYLADRQILLTGETGTTATSELVGEFRVGLNQDWGFLGNGWWDPAQNYSRQGNLRLQYRGEQNTLFNLESRYLYTTPGTPEIRTVAVSGARSLSPRWQLYGYVNYDIDLNDSRDVYLGLTYDSCCWSTRIALRRYYTNLANPVSSGIYIDFTLKGLSSTDKGSTNTLLQNGIPGYQPTPVH